MTHCDDGSGESLFCPAHLPGYLLRLTDRASQLKDFRAASAAEGRQVRESRRPSPAARPTGARPQEPRRPCVPERLRTRPLRSRDRRLLNRRRQPATTTMSRIASGRNQASPAALSRAACGQRPAAVRYGAEESDVCAACGFINRTARDGPTSHRSAVRCFFGRSASLHSKSSAAERRKRRYTAERCNEVFSRSSSS